MANSLSQIEKNLQNSFTFVKKDLMSVNEQIETLHNKIQHLSLNNASLLGEISKLESEVIKLKGKKQPKAKKKKAVVKVAKKKKAKKKAAKPVKKVIKETITYS